MGKTINDKEKMYRVKLYSNERGEREEREKNNYTTMMEREELG